MTFNGPRLILAEGFFVAFFCGLTKKHYIKEGQSLLFFQNVFSMCLGLEKTQ